MELKTKQLRGLRSFFNYLEDEDIEEIAGHPLDKWRKFLKSKQSGVVEIYVSDAEVLEAYSACSQDEKTLFKMLVYSGSRCSHVYQMMRTFDESKLLIDGEVAHYPTSDLSSGTKRTFHVFFPAAFIPELKATKIEKGYKTVTKNLQHKRVSAKTIRKWHMNLLVDEGVQESIADFVQGRTPATVGSAHYLNKVKQAKEAYRPLVSKFDIILSEGAMQQSQPILGPLTV